MVFYDFFIEITCLAEPLALHRPPALLRASPCLTSPGATSVGLLDRWAAPLAQRLFPGQTVTGCKPASDEHCKHNE